MKLVSVASAVSLVLCGTLTPSWAGFDFGSDKCKGGSGSFEVDLPQEGQVVELGTIPRDKWNVQVMLEADSDVDVQIYDTEDTTKFPEGKAIVAYCAEDGCNKGALGNNEGGEEDTVHEGMHVLYSGYYGVDGKYGHEWIRVRGVTTRSISMKVYAFAKGKAKVKYSYSRTQTPCCLGTGPCPGEFDGSVKEGELLPLGTIPAGKGNVRVELFAENDIDVQLWDVSEGAMAECPEKGKPIIAYSEAEGKCVMGMLGSSAGEESGVYEGLKYEYSGYEGVDGKPGNEFVVVKGKLDRDLKMVAKHKTGSQVKYSVRRLLALCKEVALIFRPHTARAPENAAISQRPSHRRRDTRLSRIVSRQA